MPHVEKKFWEKKSGSNLFQKSSQVGLVHHQVEHQQFIFQQEKSRTCLSFSTEEVSMPPRRNFFFPRDYFPDTCSCTCCTILSSCFHFHKIWRYDNVFVQDDKKRGYKLGYRGTFVNNLLPKHRCGSRLEYCCSTHILGHFPFPLVQNIGSLLLVGKLVVLWLVAELILVLIEQFRKLFQKFRSCVHLLLYKF